MFEAFTLKTEEVRYEEEELRINVRELQENQRKIFYDRYTKKIRDPDTYAVLNWFCIAGLHHFYLGKYIRGLINLVAPQCLAFLMLTISPPGVVTERSLFNWGVYWWVVGVITVAFIEAPALFRSQIIVKDYNNRMTRRVLSEL